MLAIKQSQATAALRQIYFVAKDALNPSQPKTGITWAAADIQISKNGGVAANSAGTVTQVDAVNFPGLYYYQTTAGEVDTLGALLLNIKNSAMVAQTLEIEIIGYDEYSSTGNLPANVVMWNSAAVVAPAVAGVPKVDVADWLGSAPAALDAGGNVPANVKTWLGTTPNILSGGNVTALVNDVAVGVTAVNEAFQIINNGTATAGAASTITLAASASATANIYNDHMIMIAGGTGVGQARIITAYTTGRVATVSPAWTTAPDATSVYVVFAGTRSDIALWAGTAPNALVSGRVDSSVGAMAANVITAAAINAAALTSAKFDNTVNIQVIRTATMQAGSTSTTAVLDASSSATDNLYKGAEIYIVSGTGAGQTRQIASYVGASKTATVNRAWATTPDATSVFQLLAADSFLQTTDIGAVWDQTRAGHTTAGTFGEYAPANVTQWQGAAPNALVAGRVDASVGAMATDSVSAAAVSAAAVTKVVNGVLDENILSHQTANSTGRAITLGGAVLAETTAAGVPTTTTLPLTAGSAVDNFYTDLMVLPVSGALAGQARIISGYVGATKTISVDEAWTSALTAGDAVVIIPRHTHPRTQIAQSIWDYVPSGVVAGSFGEMVLRPSGTVVSNAGNTTTTFCTNLTATANDYYKDSWICFLSGALVDQVHKVTAYDGTTKFVTFTTPYTAVPVAGTRFIIINK